MKSTLSLFLFFVLCTAVALAEEDDLRSRVRDVFSVRSFFSNPESARRGESRQHLEEERAVQPRGACRGNSDDEDVELCEGCNIISKWHNDLEFDGAGGFLDVDFVELHQFWRFKSDHTLIIRRTYKVYVTQEFADSYNEFAKENKCKQINAAKPFYKYTESTQGLFDYPLGCTLYTCADDSECTVKLETQKKLCFEDTDFDTEDLIVECDFAEMAPFFDGTPTEFFNKCKELDLDTTTDGELYVFLKGSASSLAASFGVLSLVFFYQFFA